MQGFWTSFGIVLACAALFALWCNPNKRNLSGFETFGVFGLLILVFLGSFSYHDQAPVWFKALVGGFGGVFGHAVMVFCRGESSFKERLTHCKENLRFRPESVLIAFFLVIPILRALSPGDMADWDTYAYHFAAPKIWLQDGAQTFLPFMHQSNFPALVDNLFLYGLRWDESAARAFTVLYLLFGTCALYGWTARLFGQRAGWLAALACIGVPVMLWSAGTGYIDMPHGFFVGLGILYLVEGLTSWASKQQPVEPALPPSSPLPPSPPQGGALMTESESIPQTIVRIPQSNSWKIAFGVIFLFCGVASKYTGLMTAFFGALLILWSLWRGVGVPKKHILKPALIGLIVGIAIACPWYIRNFQNTGNPVYPFFSSVIQTRNWDDFRAKIYAEEQASFGVGRPNGQRDWSAVGHAVLGLGYQPGRYANPNPQAGTGLPFWALGAAVLLGPLAWLAYGWRGNRMISMLLAFVGLVFLSWFVLTEQVRYLTAIVPVCSALLGIAVFTSGADGTPALQSGEDEAAGGTGSAFAAPVVRLSGWRVFLLAVTVCQALYTVWMLWEVQGKRHLAYLTSGMTREAYLETQFAFAKPAKYLDSLSDGKSKTALYGEVFGFLMDTPYFWANPGHSTLIDYDHMASGGEYATTMKSLGFKAIYLNLTDQPQDVQVAFLELLLKQRSDERVEMPAALRDRLNQDLRTRWLPLLYDAAADRAIEFNASFPGDDLTRARSLVWVIP